MKRLSAILFIVLASCQANHEKALSPAAGMFKVSIHYPNGEDKTFNMDYYEKTHMPMVAGFIGDNLFFYEIDKGLPGRGPNDKPPFAAIGYFYIKDTAAYNKSIGQNIQAVVNDFKNYTNIQPVVQMSEIKQVIGGKQ